MSRKKGGESLPQYHKQITKIMGYKPDSLGLPKLNLLSEITGIQVVLISELKVLLQLLEPFWKLTLEQCKKRLTFPLHRFTLRKWQVSSLSTHKSCNFTR